MILDGPKCEENMQDWFVPGGKLVQWTDRIKSSSSPITFCLRLLRSLI